MTPPIKALAELVASPLDFGQVQIRRIANGFELRHVADRDADDSALELIAPTGLRELARFTSGKAFRPLKSAPNLRAGWRVIADGEAALGLALNELYPGAVADWHAVVEREKGIAKRDGGADLKTGGWIWERGKITSYREFTNRQTGMYRITTMLDDTLAAAMVRACCHRDFCVKRRLWAVNEGLPEPDSISEKSLIPCLEPCAILLEFARKISRLEQEEKSPGAPKPAQKPDAGTEVVATPEKAEAIIAESDFDTPNNPRRLRFGLEKQNAKVKHEQRIAL